MYMITNIFLVHTQLIPLKKYFLDLAFIQKRLLSVCWNRGDVMGVK